MVGGFPPKGGEAHERYKFQFDSFNRTGAAFAKKSNRPSPGKLDGYFF